MTRFTVVVLSFIVISLMLVYLSDAKIDPESCVGMWLFDEGKGDVAKDLSGNGNDGTLENGPKWVEGNFGKALSFDGVDDYVHVGPLLEVIDYQQGFSYSVWARPKRLTNPNSNCGDKRTYIVNQHKTHENFATITTTGNSVRFRINSPGGSFVISQSGLPENQWYHFVGTYDQAGGGTKFFLNGELVGSKNEAVMQRDPSSGDLRVGYNNVNCSNTYFQGLIDDVAIFNVALTEGDIKNIMKRGLKEMNAVSPSGKLTTTWADIKQ